MEITQYDLVGLTPTLVEAENVIRKHGHPVKSGDDIHSQSASLLVVVVSCRSSPAWFFFSEG